MRLPFRLHFLLTGLTIIGCLQENNTRDIRSFYFPLESLEKGAVYEYRFAGEESMAPFYAYYQTVNENEITFLKGIQFNYELSPQQLSLEEVVSNGMLLTKSVLYLEADSAVRAVPVEIEAGAVFPFEVRDSSGVFLYKVKWSDPGNDEVFTRLVRNRIFAGDTIFNYNGKEVEGIKMELRELAENYEEGYIEHEFSGVELYAEGLGLVYYKKKITEDFTLEYELYNIYTLEEFEEKVGRKLPINNLPVAEVRD